ncbi:MAG: hypothetical protein H7Y07_11800, partial [Pyrinomonadaceae bacterium]|nr:hypothetical protein [Sphingobacteriaceae bacterium]
KKITWMTSHEIRRPLASILSLIGLMKNGSADDKEECLPMLYQSSEELDDIIRAVNKRINKAESLYSTNN